MCSDIPYLRLRDTIWYDAKHGAIDGVAHIENTRKEKEMVYRSHNDQSVTECREGVGAAPQAHRRLT